MAASTKRARFSHLHPVVRFFRLHARLIAACAIGLAAWFMLPRGWPLSTRLLCAWTIAIGLYLVLTAVLLARSDVAFLRRRAAEEDEGAAAIMVLSTLAAVASLAAIFAELGVAKAAGEARSLHVALAVSTIATSWLFVHVNFAQHYAHEYYGEAGERGEGLRFPGKSAPDYWDFVYFSLVIGMTFQVSDVEVTNRAVRRTVTAHGVLSFVFNTTIIALTVNIASSIFS